MKLISKIIRKLKLGKAAYTILSFFTSRKSVLSLDNAAVILHEIHPDPGNSCILPEPRSIANDSEPDLDIIIPCYNVEKYLHACINSVLSQETEYRWRIIAIDDGSTDSTGAILDEYAEDCRILVKHQQNRGLSGARNAGLSLSEAKYVLFLDSDDMLCPDALRSFLRCAEEKAADIVEGAYQIIDESGTVTGTRAHNDGPVSDGGQFGFAWGKLYRRSIFDRICFPEGYLFEDSIIAHIIFPACSFGRGTSYGISSPAFMYRNNPTGITHTGRTNPRCLDALWIHLRLFDDREKLGIPVDQAYYEYLLRMLVLTWHRTENLSEQAKQAVFTVWKDFFEKNINSFHTEDKLYRNLEKAVRAGDYGRYRLFCALN